ncbi:folate-sensitive fragile site protein Fra10Ac1-domain-containing protein [Thelephora terrestris]|uniref:Folate-sensitive fragile site protein Fra10Ac1-domain-containing protein n=1 Tax=Thelephora terrestris TaxID=56493 RepID=A0A9P6L953_9AGAM|nr:folate-sensitive fragile site protein Fra10Ac1-domain-containing protein [Thelephora terrestris]
MALQQHGSSSKAHHSEGTTEFEILKSSHQFLRPDDEEVKDLAWNDKVAKKYYDSLYKEFAVCDLKHYKSGNFSLRWRTEDEVLSGSGETTCGNTRCHHHSPEPDDDGYHLNTVELPFAYNEKGEPKSALVKVVLCDRCIKKLMYKRRKDKEAKDKTASHAAAASKTGAGDLPKDIPRSHERTSREQHETYNSSGNEGRRRNPRSRSPGDRLRKPNGRRRPRSP